MTDQLPTSGLYERLGGRAGIMLTMEQFLLRASNAPSLKRLFEKLESGCNLEQATEAAIQLVRDPQATVQSIASTDWAELLDKDTYDECVRHIITAMVWACYRRQVIEEVLAVTDWVFSELESRKNRTRHQ